MTTPDVTVPPGTTATITVASPYGPFVLPDTPAVRDQIKRVQRNIGVVQDGAIGQQTMDAVEAATTPSGPGPGPSATRTLIGSSTPPAGKSAADIEANAQTLETQLGAVLSTHRTYFEDLDATTGVHSPVTMAQVFSNDQTKHRASMMSTKKDNSHQGWPAIASQTAAVKAGEQTLAKAVSGSDPDIPVFLTLHHEPENDFGTGAKGAITQNQRDQFRSASDAFYDAMKPMVPPNVHIGPIFMQYTLTNAGANDWGHTKLWLPSKYDFIGFDDYYKGLDNIDAFVRPYGVPFIIGEFGKSVSKAGSAAAQASWLQWYLDWFDAHPGRCLAACWWNVVKMSPNTLSLMAKRISSGA